MNKETADKILEKKRIADALRQYRDDPSSMFPKDPMFKNTYAWGEILAIIKGKGYCCFTSEIIDRLIELIEPIHGVEDEIND